MLEFNDEMLIPKINGDVYFAIYELENWLRRVCLTVYMTEFGEDWCTHLPSKEYEKLTYLIGKNDDLVYLGADSDKNPIWFATLGQLSVFLKDKRVSFRLEKLTSFANERFFIKINELREIRNLLAHNRALSQSSEVIVKGIIESLRLAIRNFKQRIIYKEDMTILDNVRSDDIAVYFNHKMQGNDWSKFQAFISGDDDFYSLVCLPCSVFGKYPSGYKLITTYSDVLENILAFLVNKECDEYSILIPKKLDTKKITQIIDLFLNKPDVWTEKNFERQNPKYICNPKIWFYENQKPMEE